MGIDDQPCAFDQALWIVSDLFAEKKCADVSFRVPGSRLNVRRDTSVATKRLFIVTNNDDPTLGSASMSERAVKRAAVRLCGV